MNIETFKQHWRDYNKDKEYEDHIFVEYYNWEHKIKFLDKFIKVFWKEWNRYLTVDENIWFITDEETIYIWEEFLDICLKHKLEWDEALDFYYHNLEINTSNEELETYDQSILTFK